MGRLHLAASRRIARNENGIPFDPEKPAIAFGVRLVARIWRRPVQKSASSRSSATHGKPPSVR
jgi:hypothetical protein